MLSVWFAALMIVTGDRKLVVWEHEPAYCITAEGAILSETDLGFGTCAAEVIREMSKKMRPVWDALGERYPETKAR